MYARNGAEGRRLAAYAKQTANWGIARWRYGLPNADISPVPSQVKPSWELHEPAVDCHSNDLHDHKEAMCTHARMYILGRQVHWRTVEAVPLGGQRKVPDGCSI